VLVIFFKFTSFPFALLFCSAWSGSLTCPAGEGGFFGKNSAQQAKNGAQGKTQHNKLKMVRKEIWLLH
jgi:hypothetical protein